MGAMPEDAHLAPPAKRGVHTVEECDEVLARGPAPDVADAWLEERADCSRALVGMEAKRIARDAGLEELLD